MDFQFFKNALLNHTADFTNREKKRAKEIRFLAGFSIFAMVAGVVAFFPKIQMILLSPIDPFLALNNFVLSNPTTNLGKIINYLLLAYIFFNFIRLFIYVITDNHKAMKNYLGLKDGFWKYLLLILLIYLLNHWLETNDYFGWF